MSAQCTRNDESLDLVGALEVLGHLGLTHAALDFGECPQLESSMVARVATCSNWKTARSSVSIVIRNGRLSSLSSEYLTNREAALTRWTALPAEPVERGRTHTDPARTDEIRIFRH